MSFLAHSCYKVGMNTEDQDTRWMNMAVKLAEKGVGLTSPNPCVGAVIVHENQVIGSGFHEKAGLPHAERKAIADGTARGNATLFADSTLYVTLEPCSTTGKRHPVRKPFWNTIQTGGLWLSRPQSQTPRRRG